MDRVTCKTAIKDKVCIWLAISYQAHVRAPLNTSNNCSCTDNSWMPFPRTPPVVSKYWKASQSQVIQLHSQLI